MEHRVYCPLWWEVQLIHYWEDDLLDFEGSMPSGG